MIDPTLMLFESHAEAIILFAGMFLFVFAACLLHYREEKDKEKRKDTLVQWVVLDSLFAVGIGIASFFGICGGFV